jgi:hypothetical protein
MYACKEHSSTWLEVYMIWESIKWFVLLRHPRISSVEPEISFIEGPTLSGTPLGPRRTIAMVPATQQQYPATNNTTKETNFDKDKIGTRRRR